MKHGTAAESAPIERKGLLAIAVLAIFALLALIPAGASAAKANGSVDIDVVKRSKAGKSLVKAKVKAGKPAATAKDKKGTLLGFPVRNASVDGKVTTKLKGSIVLKAKTKKGKRKNVKLKQLTLVSRGKTAIKGKLGKKQITVFKANKGLKKKSADGQDVYSLNGAKLALNKRAAKQLSKKLKLKGKKKLKAGKAGKLWVDVSVKGEEPEPPVDDYPYAEQCPVAAAEGNPGFGEAPGTVGAIAPTPVFENAKDVTGASVDWGFRNSFRGYVSGTGSLQTLDGAVAKPQGPSMAIPGSFWEFPVSAGAYERGSAFDHSDDRIVSEGTGTVLFCNPEHGFNVVIKNPTVTIDGANSRITADVGANLNGEWYPFQRADIATLDLSGVTPNAGATGDVISWEDVPATLTEDGAKATGLYPAGTELDPITVRATVPDHAEPYPYAAQCDVPAGDAPETPPADVDGPSPFPAFESGQAVSATNVDWGFKDTFRSYVAFSPPPGSFSELDGAVAVPSSTPPGMGGAGSHWSFAGDSGMYEAGEQPDHSDDKLVADSTGTVVICKSGHGFGIVLQSPTVVIDGENSRIVASMGANYGGHWYQLQRTDVADLDLTGITPTVDEPAGTITWENVPATFAANGANASGLETHGYPTGTALDPITVEATIPSGA